MSQRRFIGRTVIVLALVAIAGGAAWFLWAVSDVLLLLLASAILAAGFAPLVDVVEGWRVPGGLRVRRGAAVFALYLAIFATITLILSLIIVPAVAEVGKFAERLPHVLAQARVWLVTLRLHNPWLPDFAGMLDRATFQVLHAPQLGTEAFGVAFRLVGWIGSAVAILVLTFYILLEGAVIKHAVLALFPLEERPRVSIVLHRIGTLFGAWLRGQALLSFLVAAPVSLGLLLLGMPYSFLLGLIAGVGEMIPMVGPTIGAAAAITVALSQPLWRLVAVVVFYLVVLNVEPHILVPRIMARVIGLSPLLALVALLIGIKLMGAVGGLLAVPVAAALQVIVSEVVREIEPKPAVDPRERDDTDNGVVRHVEDTAKDEGWPDLAAPAKLPAHERVFRSPRQRQEFWGEGSPVAGGDSNGRQEQVHDRPQNHSTVGRRARGTTGGGAPPIPARIRRGRSAD